MKVEENDRVHPNNMLILKYNIHGHEGRRDFLPLVNEYNGPRNRQSSPRLNLLTAGNLFNKQLTNSLLFFLLERLLNLF
jgi:hypothetical protein